MIEPIQLEEVGSTNDWVREHMAQLADGQWVLAERQTAGRGRMGRQWQAPAGNLSASCLVLPRPGEGPSYQLSFVMGLALADTVAKFVPASRIMLKWPNDVLLDRAKLSGILLEQTGNAVIAGVGVNLVASPPIPDRATIALAGATKAEVPSPIVFLRRLARAFEQRRALWAGKGFGEVRNEWLRLAHPVGAPVSTHIGGVVVQGRFHGLGEEGAFHLVEDDGKVHVIMAGDIVMNRNISEMNN